MGRVYSERSGQAWKHRNDYGKSSGTKTRRKAKARKAGFTPQWTMEQLWVSPLKKQWRYATDGRRMWKEWIPIPSAEELEQSGNGSMSGQTAAAQPGKTSMSEQNAAAKPILDPLLTSQTRHLTGVKIFDDWVSYLSGGCSDMANFCKRYEGLRTGDLDSLAFALTGMGSIEFQMKYRLRTLDALLRYSDLPPGTVASRSGFGSKNNLYLTCKREYGMAPMERRAAIQKPGDAGRYR